MSICSGDARVFGFHPHEVTHFARPVQVESATGGLCGAALPDGRGILVWPLGTNVRFAITDTPRDWLTNDVVTSGQIGTAVALGGSAVLLRTSVWMLDGDLFSTVIWRDTSGDGTGRNDIYKWNSASNPSSASHFATIQSNGLAGLGPIGGMTFVAGIPYRMSSGRLIITGPNWETSTFIGAWRLRAGLWSSDNGGASWTSRVVQSYGLSSTGFDYVSGQVGCDPATGVLLWKSGTNSGGALGPTDTWHSTDGAAWTRTSVTTGSGGVMEAWFPFQDGQRAWVAVGENAAGTLHRPTGNPWVQANWGPSLGRWFPVGEGGNNELRRNTGKIVKAPGGLYSFWIDRVSFLPAGGWTVGRIGF